MANQSFSPPRLRVAPSPTGDPHVGTAYMSLFNLAYARKTGGQFVLRIEDTDQSRYVADSEQQVYDCLHWLGLEPDESPALGGPYAPYRQSERLETYRPYVEQLISAGQAYYCWCSPERLSDLRKQQADAKAAVTGYDRMCLGLTREQRSALPGFSSQPVVRMRIPDDVELVFDDLIRGQISAPRPDDQVILKADGFPTYHLAVVVDDHLMGITHVVRGEEWISSTPKHRLLYKWFDWPEPAFAHMPLLRETNRAKISKRKNPAARLVWFREQGYLPEALRNFLQLMGYPPADADTEVASFKQFVETFDWAKVNTVGPVFDLAKLNWLNGHYIRTLPAPDLARRIAEHLDFTETWPFNPSPANLDRLAAAVPLIAERLTLLSEALPKLAFLFTPDDAITITPEAAVDLGPATAQVIATAIEALSDLPDFSAAAIQAALRAKLVDGLGIKPRQAFAPVRVAISGQKVSPPLFESMELLGRQSCLNRLQALNPN